jgi:hypothetical protein
MRSKLFPFAVLSALLGLGLVACGDDDGGGNQNTNTNPCIVDGNCDIQAGENGINCAADCVTQCTMTISGDDYDYIAKKMFIPNSSTSAKSTGVDLDGDGTIDNKIGGLIGALASQTDVNKAVNDTIAEGSLILLARLRVDAFPTDTVMFAQVFQGAIPTGGATPLFQGNDVVDIDEDSPTDLYLCGSMRNGTLIAGPSDLSVTFPLPGVATPLTVTLEQAQMVTSDDGEIDEDGFTGLIIGGGLSKHQVDTSIVPAVIDFLNDEIAADPTGTVASTVLEMFDGCPDYGTTIAGCEDVATSADCALDEVITHKELVCHSIVNQVLTPDVDSDGDGVKDLISLGLMVEEAVPVTINP